MRDTTKDTERISRIWRWIHNNIPGEPSRSGEDIDDCVIRLLDEAYHTGAPSVTSGNVTRRPTG
jgi:hypothetical protein